MGEALIAGIRGWGVVGRSPDRENRSCLYGDCRRGGIAMEKVAEREAP